MIYYIMIFQFLATALMIFVIFKMVSPLMDSKEVDEDGSLLCFLDLETTGLDPENCQILEVGVIVTDRSLNEISTFQKVIKTPKAVLDTMNEWCIKTHGESGLTNDCLNAKHSLDHVEVELIEFLNNHFPGGKIVLFGNSIHFDVTFIKKHMPILAKKLHYRIMDVSSLTEFFDKVYGYKIESARVPTHRVLDDIRYSITMLQEYKDLIPNPED